MNLIKKTKYTSPKELGEEWTREPTWFEDLVFWIGVGAVTAIIINIIGFLWT